MTTPRNFVFQSLDSQIGLKPEFVSEDRCGLDSCDQVGHKIFVVGRFGRPGTEGTTVAVYNVNRRSWEWVVDEGEDAQFCSGHLSFVVDDLLYTYGGIRHLPRVTVVLDELRCLDVVTMEWTRCSTSAVRPMGRYWHSGEYLEIFDKFICFGGETASGESSEVWALRLHDLSWTCAKTKGKAPKARCGLATCAIGANIFFYGGRSGQFYSDELHVLDCRRTTLEWSLVHTGTGIERAFGSMTTMDGVLLFFGGFGYTLRDCNDLLSFEASDFKPVIASVHRGSPPVRQGHTCIVYSRELYVMDGFGSGFKPFVLRMVS